MILGSLVMPDVCGTEGFVWFWGVWHCPQQIHNPSLKDMSSHQLSLASQALLPPGRQIVLVFI